MLTIRFSIILTIKLAYFIENNNESEGKRGGIKKPQF